MSGKPKFVILENGDDMDRQLAAVRACMADLKKPRDVVGVRLVGGHYYGVTRNWNSIRVYRQREVGGPVT
jgi:hypothetical protein